MASEEVKNSISDLANAAKQDLDDADWRILTSDAATLSEPEKQRTEELMEVLMRGFVTRASRGHEFVPSNRIQERFGRTLDENYPEANQVFLRFATTYWTFKLWLQDLEDQVEGEPVWAGLLAAVEQQVAALFFPTPGPAKISPEKREATQREILDDFGADFDIDEFISGNPILIRDRSQASGCAAQILLALSIGGTGLLWIIA